MEDAEEKIESAINHEKKLKIGDSLEIEELSVGSESERNRRREGVRESDDEGVGRKEDEKEEEEFVRWYGSAEEEESVVPEEEAVQVVRAQKHPHSHQSHWLLFL